MKKHNTRVMILAILCAAVLVTAVSCGEDKPQKATEQKKPKKPSGYIETVIHSKTFAETRQCQMRIQSLARELKMYAAMNGKFPSSLDELNRPKLLKSPMRDGGKYSYIAGLSASMSSRCVLVYLEQTDHEGKCHVVYLDGSAESLTPDQLDQALAKTQKAIRDEK